MRKLGVFNFLSLNSYYKGANEDIGWHSHDAEGAEYSKEGLGSGSILLFGRVTYEMMAAFWPTEAAITNMPEIANGMNKAEKIVFSRTLHQADWNNTRIINDDMVEEIRKMKQTPGKDMTILGSGTILTQLAEAGLIDIYQFMIDPVVLPAGTPVFDGIKRKLELELTSSKTLKSGVVLVCYKPKE